MSSIAIVADKSANKTVNPYLLAQKKWDVRYGSLVTGSKYWRMVAVLALSALLVLSFVVLRIGTQPRLVPFLLTQDSIGRVSALGPLQGSVPIDEGVKRREVGSWLDDVRAVTTDAYAEKKAILDRVYPKVGSNSAARAVLDDFYRSPDHDPFKLGQKETIEVVINSVLATTPHTYEVDWTETARSLNGDPISSEQWKAILTLAFNPPQNELQMWKNPLGIYVMSISWSKVL
jgi:type IV secretion system protein VirB5